jgi:hypothetical protein
MLRQVVVRVRIDPWRSTRALVDVDSTQTGNFVLGDHPVRP